MMEGKEGMRKGRYDPWDVDVGGGASSMYPTLQHETFD